MSIRTQLAVAALTVLGTASAFAGSIPYPNAGTENPVTYTFTASADGDVDAYFLGSGASYDEQLGLLVNGVDSGVVGLDNHSSSIGDELSFTGVHQGDSLTFYINVTTTGDNKWYSNPALNSDGQSNHVYSTSFGGQGTIPAGTYVGFEDLPAGGSDFNYADEQFSFTNVASISAVPEPENLALLMAGLGMLGLTALRRSKR